MYPIKMKLAILAILVSLIFSACGPKPWPEDALRQLQQSGALSEESRMVSLLANSNENQYLESVLTTYKQNFPNYADFERTAKDNPQQIKALRIPCIKRFAGSDFNSIWNIIENNEGVINLKSQLPEVLYMRYKDLMMSKFRNEFQSMNNFIDRLTRDEASVSTFIYNSDRECGEIIKNELRIEQEKLEQEELDLARLNNLFDDSSYNKGSLSFWNKTSKTITLAVVYYYYGQNWNGWVSEGWLTIYSGQRSTINLPLNSYGHLNTNIYYKNREALLESNMKVGTTIYGFVVSDDNFKIPNADLQETASVSRKFHMNIGFKLVSIESTDKYTINLTD
jgi:uncharacterized membrane protein